MYLTAAYLPSDSPWARRASSAPAGFAALKQNDAAIIVYRKLLAMNGVEADLAEAARRGLRPRRLLAPSPLRGGQGEGWGASGGGGEGRPVRGGALLHRRGRRIAPTTASRFALSPRSDRATRSARGRPARARSVPAPATTSPWRPA